MNQINQSTYTRLLKSMAGALCRKYTGIFVHSTHTHFPCRHCSSITVLYCATRSLVHTTTVGLPAVINTEQQPPVALFGAANYRCGTVQTQQNKNNYGNWLLDNDSLTAHTTNTTVLPTQPLISARVFFRIAANLKDNERQTFYRTNRTFCQLKVNLIELGSWTLCLSIATATATAPLAEIDSFVHSTASFHIAVAVRGRDSS